MASRNYAQVAPTAATIALNAYIYGYGGHSLVTPHAALKQLWWTNERIDAKVSRAFVVSKLRGEEREFLDRPLAFGEGLTDDTYMEWILDRAKRLFLILTEIGVPDQIFGCIDDSWDDDDLPIPLENVSSLELSYENDEALNKKFYDMQFVYLLRELKEGAHLDYGPKEHIPMEHVNTVPPAVCLQPYDRVHFPGRSEDVFMRRKFSLTDRDTGQSYDADFARDVRRAKTMPHEHVATTWASYTTENAGFVLSDFVAEHTLATFIEHRTPAQFMRVAATERPVLVMEWMHCLADALASLHHRGVAHTQIRPSNIWITRENRIAFADIGSLATFQRGKKFPKTEAYDYAAPEQQITKTPITLKSSPPPVSSMSAFSKLRKMSAQSVSDTSSSTSGSSGGSSTRSNSFCVSASPITPPSSGRSNSITTIQTAICPSINGGGGPKSPSSIRNFSRHLGVPCHSPTIPTGPFSPTSFTSGSMLLPRPTTIEPDNLRDLPTAEPSMSDMYSLACVFLDMLTFLLRGKITDFVKFRSTKITAPGKASSSGGGGGGKRYRTDTSFHSEPDKIAAWIGVLEEDSYRHGMQTFRGVPELLRLVRLMMAQNATLRPTALEVRDRIQEILVGECGVESLCCAGREWAEIQVNEKDDESTRSPFRRDELSIATGLLDMAPSGSGKGSRCASACGEMAVASDHMSVLSRTESNLTSRNRRRSSASTATARLSSWRSRFMRSG
ncbi:hypothetical protein M409DRAFT_64427 [Zasmidium cellare ATCC 36951]|uniref:Protein kinase domain-containing protein n=1 Tax=Zasmidium cellare ATCC 36951 TaxID=1080233 RepID=A0A6A6CV22_ZASCE|nr:uncharacterized protein M409DRAFT_64427 [Zasmidium cellare ATCC 36951]KAF2170050.1 hypothetical protein M409DRAFT_64427 [Zasmidium cellare ATCC 36951]